MRSTRRWQALPFFYVFIFLFAGIAQAETTASVVTNDAAEVGSASGVLKGTITPAGSIVAGWFEWGTTTSLGTRSDVQTFAAGTASVSLSQSLKTLQPRTTYYFRAVGYRSGAESIRGEVKTFTTTGESAPTPSAPLNVTTAEATTITSNSAVLNGTINTGGSPAAVWFDWGTTTALGSRTEVQMLGDATGTSNLTQALRNLQPQTTYYFRATAYRSSKGASSLGDVRSFTTGSGDTPTTTSLSVATLEQSSVTSSSAELRGVTNPGGTSTSAWFEWGTTRDVTNQTTKQNLGNGSAAAYFAQSVRELQPNTAYFFRALAQREGGAITRGELHSFTTSGDAPATVSVTTNDASGITSGSAELRGSVKAGGGATMAWFEWGTSGLSNQTDSQTLGTGDASNNFGQTVRNLQPNTRYYFRAVAQNGTSAPVRGSVKSFTTSRIASTTPETSEVERGAVRSGYMIITPEASSGAPTPTVTFGTVYRGSVLSQAGIVPEPMTTDASMFVEIIPNLSRNIGVAIVNANGAANAVTLTLRDEDGIILGTPAVVSVPAHQQVAKFVNELFGSDTIGTGFRGSLSLHSATPFAAVGLRFSGVVFSTLPLAATAAVSGVPSTTLAAGSSPNSPMPGVVGGATALLIPQFAIAGGWATQIALVNNTNATIVGRIDIFDASGNPLAAGLNGETRSTYTYSIPVGGAFVLVPRDQNGQSPF